MEDETWEKPFNPADLLPYSKRWEKPLPEKDRIPLAYRGSLGHSVLDSEAYNARHK